MESAECVECIVCREPVTHPLCQDCIGEAVEQWLHEEAPQKALELENETAAIAHSEGIPCVHCKGPVGVCTYCYTRHVFNWLADGKLQFSFVEYFNFDFYNEKTYGGVR